MTTHHTLLSLPLPLSLTYFKHLQRISISLSLHSKHFTNTTPLLSLPFALANIFSSTYSTSLSLSALHAPANHHTPPLAPSRSLSLSLTYRYRGAADSGYAASACDVHHNTQQTRRPARGFCRRSPTPPPEDGWHPWIEQESSSSNLLIFRFVY